eukprot:SAG31_NODE_257_length_18942_cov_6.099135_15_plen_95_part_00
MTRPSMCVTCISSKNQRHCQTFTVSKTTSTKVKFSTYQLLHPTLVNLKASEITAVRGTKFKDYDIRILVCSKFKYEGTSTYSGKFSLTVVVLQL